MGLESPLASKFRGLNLDDLGLDEAYLNVTSAYQYVPVYLYKLSENCDRCPYHRVGEVRTGLLQLIITTGSSVKFSVLIHRLDPMARWRQFLPITHTSSGLGTVGQRNLYHMQQMTRKIMNMILPFQFVHLVTLFTHLSR